MFVDYTATSIAILSTKARGAIASGVAYTGSGIAGGAFQYDYMQYMKTVLAPGPPPTGIFDGAGAAAAAAPEGVGDGDYVMGSGECVMCSGGKGKGGLKGGSGGGKGKTCLWLGRESFRASHADAGLISQATQTDGDEGNEWLVVR